MPRTSALECPGCPPIRALTFDVLGLIKVVEARGNPGIPKVVDRWGEPDSSRCVLAASIEDRNDDPMLAVARKNGLIEVLNPLNGDLHVTITKVGDAVHGPEDDPIAGLHLFRREWSEMSSSLLKTALVSSLQHGLQRQHSFVKRIIVRLWLGPTATRYGYDISSQRRPVISFDFRESPIKALTEDLDGYTIYFGTGSGDLASVDMRTGTFLVLRGETVPYRPYPHFLQDDTHSLDNFCYEGYLCCGITWLALAFN